MSPVRRVPPPYFLKTTSPGQENGLPAVDLHCEAFDGRPPIVVHLAAPEVQAVVGAWMMAGLDSLPPEKASAVLASLSEGESEMTKALRAAGIIARDPGTESGAAEALLGDAAKGATS